MNKFECVYFGQTNDEHGVITGLGYVSDVNKSLLTWMLLKTLGYLYLDQMS